MKAGAGMVEAIFNGPVMARSEVTLVVVVTDPASRTA